MKGVEYRGVSSVDGPIIALKRTENIFYNETVCVRDRNGNKRKDVYVLAKGADFCGAKSSEASEKDFTEAFDDEEELD